MLIYFLQYFTVSFLSFLTTFKYRAKPFITPIIILLLFLLPALRGSHVSRDYSVYVGYFQSFMGQNITYLGTERMTYNEPSFYFIPLISRFLVGSGYLLLSFAIFALLGVYFKIKAFSLSNSFFLSTILYVSNFYLLHEMTQIRVGVATGILLLSIRAIYDRRPMRFLGFILAACFFHYSSILFLPLYFLSPTKVYRVQYISLIVFAFILAAAKVNLLEYLPLSNVLPKIDVYMKQAEKGTDKRVSLYNISLIVNMALSILFIIKSAVLTEKNKYVPLMLKINVLSILSFLFLYQVPVFSIRVSELFGVVQICLLPCAIYIFDKRILGYTIIICLSLLNFYKFLFVTKLFSPYYTWLF